MGSGIALGNVLLRYEKILLRYARRQFPADLRSKGDASDLVQDTLLEAHRDFSQFTGASEGELLAWLHCLLRHNLANFVTAFRRREKRQVKREQTFSLQLERRPIHRALVASATGPGSDAIRNESTELCRRALAGLPEISRNLVRLRFEDRLSYVEIGLELKMSAEAARKLLMRTLHVLGNRLGPE